MSAFFSNKKERRRAERQQAHQSLLAATAVESAAAAEARQRSAEEARANVFGMLGAPGTYDLPGTAGGGTAPPGAADFSNVYQSGTDATQVTQTARSLLTQIDELGGTHQARSEGELGGTFDEEFFTDRKGIIDAGKYAEQMGKTSAFRMQSRLQADAEQLLAREGPAWDRLENSTTGQIIEGAATQLRETMRELKNRAAKGGTARRTALNETQQILAMERANTARVNQTWQANLALDSYVRENAQRVQEGNARFLDNLPMLRDQYNATMNSLAEMMAGVAVPSASQAMHTGYQARAAVKDTTFWGKLATGVVGAVIGYYSGGNTDAYNAYGQGGAPSGAQKQGFLRGLIGDAVGSIGDNFSQYSGIFGRQVGTAVDPTLSSGQQGPLTQNASLISSGRIL